MSSSSSAQPEPTMEEILASIRRIISEDSEPAKPQAAVGAPTRQSDPEVLELTQVAAEEQAPIRPEPMPERRATVQERPRAARSDPIPERVQPRPAPQPQPMRNQPDVDMIDNDDRDNGLVSGSTQSAISQAFNMLARDSNDVPIAKGEARTLEEIVAQMLKPMLKDWLEDNLPAIVERVVREEVERAARTNRRR